MTNDQTQAGRDGKPGLKEDNPPQAKGGHGTPQQDAKGAAAGKIAGSKADGVASAQPRIFSGSKGGDATFQHKFNGGNEP